MLMRETAVVLDGPMGALEALYLTPENPRGLALLCHPNPVQGGTMQNKVISTLQRTARDQGFITLRFNYRGVGASAGVHDMGEGEVDDAEAAVKWLLAKHPDLPLTVLGFSFGGFVAATLSARLAAQNIAVAQTFMVAPAVHRLDAKTDLSGLGRLTVIQPETDEVIEPASVYSWSAQLAHPHELLKVAECGHFFHGKLTDLKDLVVPRL